MDISVIQGIQILRIAVTVWVFLFVYALFMWRSNNHKQFGLYRELDGFLKKAPVCRNWYQQMQSRLNRYGAGFHYGRRIGPVNYFLIRLVLLMTGIVVIGKLSVELGIVSGLALFFLPDVLLMYMNKKDNEKMLPEIKLIYHTMEIQIKAGVYVMDALVECYGGVSHNRLKAALLDLAGDVAVHADVYEALEDFQAKFDNAHINALCVTIYQALESGQAVELLRDLGEQVKDMEQLVLAGKKASLDRSLTFYQLGILTVLLGLTLYVCIVQMLGVAVEL